MLCLFTRTVMCLNETRHGRVSLSRKLNLWQYGNILDLKLMKKMSKLAAGDAVLPF